MLRVFLLSLLLSTWVSADSVGGMNLAFTQHFLDYAIGLLVPISKQFVNTYKWPNPLLETKKDSLDITLKDLAINLDNIGMNFSFAEDASSKAGLSLAVHSLDLDIGISAHIRETVWPHPTANPKIHAKSDGSHAQISFDVQVANGIPTIALKSCNAQVKLSDIKISGLSIFDYLAEWIVDLFKKTIEKKLDSTLCEEAVKSGLVAKMNSWLSSYKWALPLPFPAPFDQASLDFHLASTPAVITTPTSKYLSIKDMAEVFPKSGSRDPDKKQDVLPDLDAQVLGSHMVQAEVGTYPANSALWTFWSEGRLTYNLKKNDLPTSVQSVLTTPFYKLLLPRLVLKYPDSDMQLLINTTTAPKVFMSADGTITAVSNMTFDFNVLSSSTTTDLAFSLRSPFHATAKVVAGSATVSVHVDDVDVDLFTNKSPYGIIGPALISLLSRPVNTILNSLLIPVLNKRLVFELPIIQRDLGEYGVVTAKFINPEIKTGSNYFLVGTDLSVTIKPHTTSNITEFRSISAKKKHKNNMFKPAVVISAVA